MINCEQINNNLYVSFVDSNRDISNILIPIPKKEQFKWSFCDKNDSECDKVVTNWDGRNVKKEYAYRLNKYRIAEFLSQQPEHVKEQIFSEHIPKKVFCDIETEILDEFPNPNNPQAEVLSIALVDDDDVMTILTTKKISKETAISIKSRLNSYFSKFNKTIRLKYKWYANEFDMLNYFFTVYMKEIPFITGWNFTQFDWNYLTARALFLNIDIEKCSPTNKMYKNMPLHKIVVDYMDVYKKWDLVVAMKEVNSLDYVSAQVLGIKKLAYSGSLKELYQNNVEDFLLYNAIDTYLVKMIDEKLNTLSIYFKLSYLTKIEQAKVFSPVAMVENIMVEELWNKHKKVFVEDSNKKSKDGKYDGAFVLNPITGRHEYICVFDYSSLYPSIIRQWNISPDVYIGKDINTENKNVITTASGTVFKKDEDGVLKTLLDDFFSKRKNAKNIASAIEVEINYLNHILLEK